MNNACSPSEFVDQCRLALDPVKSAHVFHVRERLRKWLSRGAARELSLKLRRAYGTREDVWCADLLDAHSMIASALSHDADDALASALQIAGDE